MKTQVAVSLMISVAACFLPRLFSPGSWDSIIPYSLGLGVLWLGWLVAALIKHKKKGLWFLVGLPFALYWPGVLLVMLAACLSNTRYCP